MAKQKQPEDGGVVDLAKEIAASGCGTEPCPKHEALLKIKELSQVLVLKLIELEQDANFRGVFAISQLNGYPYKGKLWVQESQELAGKLDAFNKEYEQNAKSAK